MNQYFNLARFGHLLRKHAAEYATSYLLGTAVLLGGILLVMGFLAYVQGGLSQLQQSILCLFFLLGAGSFFTSLALGQYGQGSRAALALTLPASHLEKYLVAWVFSLPVFLVVFLADFYLADWLILRLSPEPDTLANVLAGSAPLRALGVFLLVHALALWGSIFFRRQAFLKTMSVLLVMLTLLSTLNFQALKVLLGQPVQNAYPFGTVQFTHDQVLTLADGPAQWVAAVPLVLAALLWLAAYARLTEKQL